MSKLFLGLVLVGGVGCLNVQPIGPLAKHEVEQYIHYRWTKCGGAQAIPFSAEALKAIASWSQGIPRLINSICDNALTAAFGLGASVIEASHIAEVAVDLDLKAPLGEHHEPAPAPAAPIPPNNRLARVPHPARIRASPPR